MTVLAWCVVGPVIACVGVLGLGVMVVVVPHDRDGLHA